MQVEAQLKRLTQLLNAFESKDTAVPKRIKPGSSKLAKREKRATAKLAASKKPKASKAFREKFGGVQKPKNKDKYNKKKLKAAQ